MKPAEKEVLKAGLVNHLTAMVRREIRILEQVRREMHLLRSQKPSARPVTLTDWEGYKGIVNAQIMVIRRTKIALEAAEAWHQLRTNLLVISSPAPACRNCGYERHEHDPKSGTCLKGATGEDATGYEPTTRLDEIERELREAGQRQWDSDNDPRWKDVNDDTIVMWDRDGQTPEPCRWGGLMQADRKTVEMHEDGTLHGGYPF